MNAIRSIGCIRPLRKVAVVDVDEVLFPFIDPFLKWSNLKPYKEKYSSSISNITRTSDHYIRGKIDQFMNSDEFKLTEPIDTSHHGLAYLREHSYKIYAVSGRKQSARGQTEHLLDTYFPYMVDDLFLTNKYSTKNVSKISLYHCVGADIVISDSIDTCHMALYHNINAINFVGDPVYPWCDENPHSVRKWTDVVLKVDGISSRSTFF